MEFDDMNADDSSGDDGAGESSGEDPNSDDDDVRVAVPRKQKFRGIDEVLDEDNYDPLPEQEDRTFVWKSKDRNDPTSYTWKTNFNKQGRAGQRNVYHNRPGPSPEARRCSTLKELWDKFITRERVQFTCEYTNTKIDAFMDAHPKWKDSNKYPYTKHLTEEEAVAFFATMYVRAVSGQNLLSVKKLYQHKHALHIYKAFSSQNRYEFLISIMQFDDVEDRAERWENDRFAAFRDFFNSFNEQCSKLRIPSEFLSLDETLYPFRGRISMKQYNPNKPAKYGMLYRSISDARLPYTYNTLPYAGKPNVITEESEYVTGTDNYTKYLVKGLERFTNLKGRNLSIDRYFTSMSIAEWLLNRGLTVVGTLRQDRKGIPDGIKTTDGRENLSTMYAYCEDIKSLLVSYVVEKKKGKKNVLVLTSMHKDVSVTQDQRLKPNVISFYDHTKGGVDVMDQIAGVYTTRCKTHRWTINALSYVLDTVRTNMNTLWNEMYPEKKMSSFDFLWALADELIKPWVQTRYNNRTGLQKHIVVAMMGVLGIEDYVPDGFEVRNQADYKRCFQCLADLHGKKDYKKLKNKLGKHKFVCDGDACTKTLCKEHFKLYCNSCLLQLQEK